MKDSATDAAKSLAGAMMKQGMDAAGETIKKAVAVPAGVAAKAMSAATQAASASGAKAAAKKSAQGRGREEGAGPQDRRLERPASRAAKPRAS